MKKKFLAAAIGAMLVGGSAFAGANDVVRVATDGVGDALIAPAYFIGGGMETEFKVINTDMSRSVVAKVVFHHPVTSGEVLDFLIYLTPGDVWKGTVSCVNADSVGTCTLSQVESLDGSMEKDGESGVFGSSSSAATIKSGVGVVNRPDVLPNQGYVTITESKALSVKNSQGLARPGVAKADLKKAYLDSLNIDPLTGNINNPAVGSDDTPNVLTGSVTAFSKKDGKIVGSATLPLLALKDHDNAQALTVGANLGINSSHKSLAAIEDALWSNNYVVPYTVTDNMLTLVTFTFPTKLTYDDRDGQGVGEYKFGLSTAVDAVGAGKIGGADVLIAATAFDNDENNVTSYFNVSPLPKSKNIRVSEFGWKFVGKDLTVDPFKEGWLNVSFVNPQTSVTGKVGAPAIVTVLNNQSGNLTWSYAASATSPLTK